MPTIKSPRLRSAALASLAAAAMMHPPAAGAPVSAVSAPTLSVPPPPPNTFNKTGWPEFQEATFNPQLISVSSAPNAILFDGTDFLPQPTEWLQFENTSNFLLPASCYNCNPKGCMCSPASLKAVNNTDTGKIVNQCQVCRDSPSGMVCYCSVEQFEGGSGHVCEELVDPAKVDPKFGKVCRLNKMPAGVPVIDIVGGGPNMSENMLVSSGGSKRSARSAAAVAGAALGTAAAMFL